jgi:hypothetical protein
MAILLAPIAIDLDASAYLASLEELRLLASSLPEGVRKFLVGVFNTSDQSSQLGTIEQHGLPALGAGELRVCLKPSDRFLMLVAALRAGDCDLAAVKKIFGHGSSSVGCLDNSNEDRAPGESQSSSGGHRYNLDGTS